MNMILPLSKDQSEGDVEVQVLGPLLSGPAMLAIPKGHVRSKEHLRPIDIDKGASKRKGYFPDFSVYIRALPVCLVEAKSPVNSTEEGYREAALYAHEINKKFEPGINPCQCIIATNGVSLLAGYWDADAALKCNLEDILIGSEVLAKLQDLVGFTSLVGLANHTSSKIRLTRFQRPFNQGEGPTLINSKVGNNSFAADLSPILRRYFTSHGQQESAEIWKKAYIASNEVTTYDKALESFLKERISSAKSSGKKMLSPTRSKESSLESVVRKYGTERPEEGALQLITGSVGAGKSLFARRYKEELQPTEIADVCHWAFLNFNDAPPKLESSKEWVCKQFVASLLKEGAPVDLENGEMQEKVFAANLRARKPYYERMNSIEERRGDLEAARDLEQWRQEPETLAFALSRFLHGDKGENIIVVFDNVDRRNADEQLECFQLALWFMAETRSLILLSMRDVTFELFKNEPPLDTYKSGTVFHISPPRFIDVVKRRLELSLEAMQAELPQEIGYSVQSGARIKYDASKASAFLRTVYDEIFERPRNISKVIEALAARNVRQSLDMFMSILTSGHMAEDTLAQITIGDRSRGINEYTLIKILMRGDNRFYNDSSGVVANIFYCDDSWIRPSNFLCIEILYWLIGNRKERGDNGHMGYFSLHKVMLELEKLGFVQSDVKSACDYLNAKCLIEPDTLSQVQLDDTDCIKVTASGFIHMRILSERIEYLYSVLPTTALNSVSLSSKVFDAMVVENSTGRLSVNRILGLIEPFIKYLSAQRGALRKHDGYASKKMTGADYVIGHIENALNMMKGQGVQRSPVQQDFLDTI